MSVFSRGKAQRGFKAAKQEIDRREKAFEAKKGKLFRFYLKDGDADIPVRFLTAEPILYYEHSIPEGGRNVEYTCTGEDCEHCANGVKAVYKGAWLCVDGREFERDEWKDGKKTGKKEKVKDRLKLYVRGQTDIAKLDHKNKKFGLTTRPWFVTKTGKNQSTSYELERGDEDKLTKKQIQNLIAQLPEKYRDMYDPNDSEESLMDIVEAQIFGHPDDQNEADTSRDDEDDSDDSDDDDTDVDDGVIGLDDEDEEEEEKPRKKFGLKGKKKETAPASKKAGIRKPSASKPSAASSSKPKPKAGIRRKK